MVQHEHHEQFMASALKNNKPPPGLTPKVNLTAKGQTSNLLNRVDSILKEAGLQIVNQLLLHHQEESTACKTKAEKIRLQMEECAKNAHTPFEQKSLLELAIKLAKEAQENWHSILKQREKNGKGM